MVYHKFKIFGTIVQITQFFGERPGVYSQFHMDGHNGDDMVFADGRNHCLAAGVISGVYYDPKGYGHYHRIHTDDGFEDTYGHFATTPIVTVGQRVELGQDLGPMGMSGFSTGPHLHYGRKPLVGRNQANGYLGSVDPWPYLERVLSNKNNENDMTQEQENKLNEVYAALQEIKSGCAALRQRDTDGALYIDSEVVGKQTSDLDGRIWADSQALSIIMRAAGMKMITKEESKNPKYVLVGSARQFSTKS